MPSQFGLRGRRRFHGGRKQDDVSAQGGREFRPRGKQQEDDGAEPRKPYGRRNGHGHRYEDNDGQS